MWEEIKEYVNIQKALQCCSLQLATFSCSVQMQLQFSKRVDPSQVVIVTQADHSPAPGKALQASFTPGSNDPIFSPEALFLRTSLLS